MIALVCLWLVAHQTQTTSLHGLFTDNMVLQRDRPMPIWGSANPSQKIVVVLGDQTVTTEANSNGAWSARLSPMHAGGPYTLVVTGDRKIVVQNVSIGEVWICSGQSNMQWPVSAAKNSAEEISRANYPIYGSSTCFTGPWIYPSKM